MNFNIILSYKNLSNRFLIKHILVRNKYFSDFVRNFCLRQQWEYYVKENKAIDMILVHFFLLHSVLIRIDVTSFAGFFNFPLMRGLLENFCVYHVTAPGQEETAPTLPEE